MGFAIFFVIIVSVILGLLLSVGAYQGSRKGPTVVKVSPAHSLISTMIRIGQHSHDTSTAMRVLHAIARLPTT